MPETPQTGEPRPETPGPGKPKPEMPPNGGRDAAGPETPGKADRGGREVGNPPADSTTDGGTTTDAPAADGRAQDAERISALESLVIHLKADFDNFKKRTQKESAGALRMGELDAVKRFLPIFANLERAVAAGSQQEVGSALADGVRQIYEQLQATLKSMGVERVPAVGLPFDPTQHEAVAATVREDLAPGTVTDEFEPGYRADGRALIPAKVRVSTKE